MGSIISLAICIILCIIFCVFCGYITKAINESKGYTGGFWLGLLLQPLGILIVSQKAEQPNAKEYAFKAVLLQNVFKKYRYPFAPPQFEPIAMLKGEINTEAKAAGLNLTFMLIHGVFMLGWYSVILGAYLWYIMGYSVYWLFKSQSLKKIVDDAMPDAAEKVAFAKEKTRAAFEGLKDKAAALAAEHKKSSDENISTANEGDTEENYNKSSNEAVYQNDEEYDYETTDPIAADDTSYEHESDENNSPAPEQSSIICKKDSQGSEIAADDANIQPAPMSSSPVYNTGTFSYNENKKSPIIYILIGVISVLLVVLGVLFGMLLMKNKNDRNDNNSANVINSTSVENTSATESIVTTAVESSEKTTTTSTVPVESTTQTTNSNSDQYTSDEVSAMFSAYIAENPDPNRTYDNSDYGYALIDLNNDDTQELLITEGEKEKGSPWIIGVYTIKNSKLTLLMGFDSRFPGSLYEDNIISFYSSLGQGGGTAFYKYTSGDSLDMVDIISFDYSSGTKVMYHNSNVITEAESYSILANYKPIQFEPKSLKINIQPTTSAPTETYAFYGIVATESDSLNLRDKPSTNSDVITQLPKGTKANVYYVEGYSDWYKIYTDNGYEGYVAAQYMKEYNESSNNNNTSYVPESQTPFGTFTYTNYRSSAYSSYTIYEPDTIGIYLNCDIDAFNAKHSDYRIDNIYFWTVKEYSSEGPHDYRMYFTFTGTVLSDSINKFELAMTLKNEETGESSITSCNGFKATLYKGETFCYDMISGYDYGEYVLDNTTYTLK